MLCITILKSLDSIFNTLIHIWSIFNELAQLFRILFPLLLIDADKRRIMQFADKVNITMNSFDAGRDIINLYSTD